MHCKVTLHFMNDEILLRNTQYLRFVREKQNILKFYMNTNCRNNWGWKKKRPHLVNAFYLKRIVICNIRLEQQRTKKWSMARSPNSVERTGMRHLTKISSRCYNTILTASGRYHFILPFLKSSNHSLCQTPPLLPPENCSCQNIHLLWTALIG